MFGSFRIAKARTACVQALQPFVVREFGEPWPPEFWRDPFLIGFIVNVIGMLSHLATGGKLTTEQRGQVLISTLKDLGGYSPDFADKVAALGQAGDPAFRLGARNAETVVTYVMRLHPMTDDPDVAAATEVAKRTTLTGEVSPAEIGGSLMHMLFTHVVKGRLAT